MTPPELYGPELPGLKRSSRWTYLELSRYNAWICMSEFGIYRVLNQKTRFNFGPCHLLWGSNSNTFDFWPDFAKNQFNPQLCTFILAALCASILVPLCASILGALCVGWVNAKFEVFHRWLPSYRGLIWFSCGLGGKHFLNLKGNNISDPPPDIFSTCSECITES